MCRIESPDAVRRGTPTEREPTAYPDPPRQHAPGTSAAAPPPVGLTVPCTITRVVDGDTVHCAGGVKVRLLLIDAPESDQVPYGDAATRALWQLVPIGTAATLELDLQHRDRYGRLLAYVYTPDGRMANEEMVRAGYAHVSTYPPNVRYVERMVAAQHAARVARRGLWSSSAFDCLPAAHRRRAC